MESTGIVRKIDNLGRIVIPREIRRTLKIKEGSPLEIYIERDMIALKKHSITDTLKNVAYLYTESAHDTMENPIVITDKEKIIASAGIEEDYQNLAISEYLENCIKNRFAIIENKKTKISLAKNKKEEQFCYTIQPIENNGDIIGLVIILNSFKLTELEEKTAKMIAEILSKYIEE